MISQLEQSSNGNIDVVLLENFAVSDRGSRHFQVRASDNALDDIIQAAPIAHEIVETPLLSWNVPKKRAAVGMFPIDLRVRSHDSPGLRLLERHFRGPEVDLA